MIEHLFAERGGGLIDRADERAIKQQLPYL